MGHRASIASRVAARRNGDRLPARPRRLASLAPPARATRRRRGRLSCRSRRTDAVTAATAVPVKSATRNPPPAVAWSRKHLLGLEDLSRVEIELVLDRADGY